MRGPSGGRRRPKDSFVTNAPPPPPPLFSSTRDSDVSFCSSRPSSSSIGAGGRSSIPISDRSYQVSAVRTVNSYLSSHSLPFSLKSSLPSARDILETLRFALARLDFPTSRLEDDLQPILKHLNFPVKLNKSALRAPGTPHSWPSLLAVIHFLIQVAMYNDHLLDSSSSAVPFEDNTLFVYAINSYLRYISGDDEAVDALDGELSGKLEQEKETVVENVKGLKRVCEELEVKMEGLRSGLSPREVMEKERVVLEEDVKKFHAVIDQFSGKIAGFDKVLEEKAKELAAKEEGKGRICEENEELKKKVEEQKVNLWDAERMKRELQAVESNIEAAESERNEWEEKTWDLDSPLRHKLKEMEEISIECNQAIRRLKLANGIQYVLNAKGSTPVEVLGIDYKLTIKPALDSLSNDIKNSSIAKLEEKIYLQQQSAENAAKIVSKNNRYTALQSHIGDVEARMNLWKKETLDYISGCEMEARKMMENMELEAHNLDALERETAESLQISELKKQEAIRQSEEDIQNCCNELFGLVDSISKYKEFMATKIFEMERGLSETAGAISDAYKSTLQLPFNIDSGAVP